MGRPSIFRQEQFDEICRRLAQGESLNAICKADDMPDEVTVRGWVLDDYQGVSAKYTRARELQAFRWADELVEVSDDGSNDWMERQLENGRIDKMPDYEHITRSRLRVDTRKWLLSKMLPKLYGDKLDTTRTLLGADGTPVDPTRHTVSIEDHRSPVANYLDEFAADVVRIPDGRT